MILNAAETKLVELWKSNPSLACNDLLHYPLSDSLNDQFVLIPPQRIVANRVWRAKSSIVLACRGFGKTRMAATLAILQAWLHPGRQVGCLSASFRQAKQIFDEIDKIWDSSPLLKQATTRRPILANDACKLTFKRVGTHYPSVIKALPLADGTKIRGARFHSIFIDEAVHVPEDTFNLVIRPMAATHQNPVLAMHVEEEKIKIKQMNLPPDVEAEEIKRLEDFVGANQITMLTSGWYTFNYVYGLYEKYSKRMHGDFSGNQEDVQLYEDDDLEYDDPLDYATFQIPWQAIPSGFLDKKGLRQAMNDMHKTKFRMEYEAAWISDTGGFFKMSDIHQCRAHKLGLQDLVVTERGDSRKMYVMGVDPARKKDKFAIVIFEYDPTFGAKLVHAEQHKGPDAYLPKMATRIFELSNQFNFIRIGIDRFGGGQGLADILAQGSLDGTLPLYDMDEERYKNLRGRHIVKLQVPDSNWIDQANNNVKNMMEKRQIAFPDKRLDEHEGENDNVVHDTINKLIDQLLSIEVTETRTGRSHYDLPESGSHFEQHKDLYSAFIIGADICYQLFQREKIPQARMPLMGIITPRIKGWFGY